MCFLLCGIVLIFGKTWQESSSKACWFCSDFTDNLKLVSLATAGYNLTWYIVSAIYQYNLVDRCQLISTGIEPYCPYLSTWNGHSVEYTVSRANVDYNSPGTDTSSAVLYLDRFVNFYSGVCSRNFLFNVNSGICAHFNMFFIFVIKVIFIKVIIFSLNTFLLCFFFHLTRWAVWCFFYNCSPNCLVLFCHSLHPVQIHLC